jgi:hypothetical protein
MWIRMLSISTIVCLASTALAADPPQMVADAVQKLSDTRNFSWRAITRETSQSLTVIEDGQTQEDGSTLIRLNSGGSSVQIALKGSTSVLNAGGGWMTSDEATDQRQAVRFMSTVTSPALVASRIASRLDNLRADGGEFVAQISGGEVNNVISPLYSLDALRIRGVNESGAKATVKFWITEGRLTKYQVHATGTMSRGGTATPVDLTVTVDFRDIGKTKVSLPDQAKKKLG